MQLTSLFPLLTLYKRCNDKTKFTSLKWFLISSKIILRKVLTLLTSVEHWSRNRWIESFCKKSWWDCIEIIMESWGKSVGNIFLWKVSTFNSLTSAIRALVNILLVRKIKNLGNKVYAKVNYFSNCGTFRR